MKSQVKVSVCIPVYNSKKFIVEAIESVLSQDYRYFEVIVINDGSCDGTTKIIKRHFSDFRLRYYTQKHQGIAATRNRLVELSRGKYISPQDADDIMLPGKLKRLAEFLDKNPQVGVIYGNSLKITENGTILKERYMGKPPEKFWDLFSNCIPHGSSMVRKSKICTVGGYDESLTTAVDYDLWLKLFEVTKFVYINEFFYASRLHPERTTYKYSCDIRFSNRAKARMNAIKRRHKKKVWFDK